VTVCQECKEWVQGRRRRCLRCGALVCGSCHEDSLCLTCLDEIVSEGDDGDRPDWEPVYKGADQVVGWRRGHFEEED